jgi:hypothetical protein
MKKERKIGGHAIPQPLIDRLLRHITMTPSGCWEWNGQRDKHQYGLMAIRHNGKEKPNFVHRIAFSLFHEEWNGASSVLHHCDNPPCCNPLHLFAGNQQDNVDDMMSKGRHGYKSHPGEENGRATLTVEQVIAVKTLHSQGVKNIPIGEQLGIPRWKVAFITGGKTWRNVTSIKQGLAAVSQESRL